MEMVHLPWVKISLFSAAPGPLKEKKRNFQSLIKIKFNRDDAREAVKHGLDGILVSNHGARQLDGVPATARPVIGNNLNRLDLRDFENIDALPEIVEAVEGKVEVFLDGGVRKGTDVLKALALGAKAVFVGRPIIWGLASQIVPVDRIHGINAEWCQNVKVIDKTLVRGSKLRMRLKRDSAFGLHLE
ncbi:hypothetical protein MC885_000242 [Smutsia gigantea]|nr:hypothetical protein MC885_000242 [Smutsia gigantea]